MAEEHNPEENSEAIQNSVVLPKKESSNSFLKKVLFGLLALPLLVWAGLSMCSSPPPNHKKTYFIGLDPSWYPLQDKLRERNMTAFVETLLREFAYQEKFNIKIIETSQNKLMAEFANKKYDAIVSMILPLPSSTGGYPYIFSAPIYRLGPVLVLDKNSSYTSLEEMSGKIIGLAGNARFEINIANYPKIIFSGYNDIFQALTDLNNHKLDGIIADSLQAKTYAQGLYAEHLKIADFSLTNEGILMIFHKNQDNEQFAEQFNTYLKESRKDGSYSALLKQWQIIGD